MALPNKIMNLDEATAALLQKDSARATAQDVLQELEARQVKGLLGDLKVSVYQIDGMLCSDSLFSYKCSNESFVDSFPETSNLKLSDTATFALKSKDLRVIISALLSSAELPEPTSFSVSLSAEDVPEDTELRTELEALHNDKKIVLHLKTSFDNIAALIANKRLELKQLETEFTEASEQVKSVKSQRVSTTAKSGLLKTSKKKKRDAGSESSEGILPMQLSSFDRVNQMAVDTAMFAVNFGITNRAVAFFIASGVGIYLYGDYLSV